MMVSPWEITMEKIYDDGYFSIFMDEVTGTLNYKILGYPKFSEIIRKGHDEVYQIVSRRHHTTPIKNIVADLLDAKILLTPDIRFIGKVSYPRLAKAGVKNLAILLTGEIQVKINVQKTLQYLGPKVFQNVKLFPTLTEAEGWFKEIND